MLSKNEYKTIDSGISWFITIGWMMIIYRLYDEMINSPCMWSWEELLNNDLQTIARCTIFLASAGAFAFGPITIFINHIRGVTTPLFIRMIFGLYVVISAIGNTAFICLVKTPAHVPLSFTIYIPIAIMYAVVDIIGAIVGAPREPKTSVRVFAILYSFTVYSVLFMLVLRPAWFEPMVVIICGCLIFAVVCARAIEIFVHIDSLERT